MVISLRKPLLALQFVFILLNQKGWAQSCSSPTTLTVGAAAISGNITSSMTGSVTTYYSQGCAVPDGTCSCNKYEHWYKFTTTIAGNYTITVVGMCGANGCTVNSGMNPVVELRTNACGGALIQGENSTGRAATEVLTTATALTAATTYKIRVYSYHCNDAAPWTYSIKVDPPPCTPPGTTTVNSTGTFCGQTTLLASGGTGGTIYFQGTTSGGTSTAKPSTAEIINTSGTYYFNSYNGTCWGQEGSATVTITSGPCLQWLNQNCTVAATGSYIDGGTINPTAVQSTASMPTTTGNYGYVFWKFNALKDSTYYFDLCASTGTSMSRLRLHNARNTTPGNNYCMDAGNTPTLVLENIANGCVGTGTGLSKLIWTCQASGTYYLESAGEKLTYWGVQSSQTATLSYKTIPSNSITCGEAFYDKGRDGTNGSSANYNNNENWIYTYYPLDTVADAINVQFVSFSTSPGDILCVYNGNSINAPIIGCYSGPSITGAFSSTANDGSLTFQFTSDDSLISGGWEANVSCVASLGVDHHAVENKFSIYPNPVKDQISVFSYGLRVGKIEIYNLVGDKVYTLSTPPNIKSQTSVDVRMLPAGIYFIQVSNESGNWNGRFVKQ